MGYNSIHFSNNTVFLVTGGAGFIGSNLCKAILRFFGGKLGVWMI